MIRVGRLGKRRSASRSWDQNAFGSVVLGPLARLVPSHELVPYAVLALLIPSLTYLLLSWVWLIARVMHDLFGGTPRGGHPVGSES
jgi:hypothetical protein